VAEAESKISGGEINRDYAKLTNLYTITFISMAAARDLASLLAPPLFVSE
jgi:hypothetical protein